MKPTDREPTHKHTGVRLVVREETGELHYVFASPAEAAEMIAFLRPFLPGATFELSPLRH